MFRCPRCDAELNPIGAVAICPICLAKNRVRAPLQFEIGWHRALRDPSDRRSILRSSTARRRLPAPQRSSSQVPRSAA